MVKVSEILSFITDVAPLNWQESYDNSGLLIGDPNALVDKVLLTLDVTEKVIDEAIDNSFHLIISHHPLIFRGIKNILNNNTLGRIITKAIKHDISIAAMHTNLDNSYVGVNNILATNLGLKNLQILRPNQATQSLNDVEYQVGSGIGYRFLTLAGPAVWHKNAGAEEATLLLSFALGWTLLFGILLAHTMHRVCKRNKKAASQMLRNDILSACIICFLPSLLKGIPGNWEIFLAQLVMVPLLMNTWNALRRVYDLPVGRSEKKR